MLRMKALNILCRYNGEFLSVRAGGTHCYGRDIKGYQLITLAIYTIIIFSDQYDSSLPAAIQMRVGWEDLLRSNDLCDERAVGKQQTKPVRENNSRYFPVCIALSSPPPFSKIIIR
jgi:hypothetical protein